MTEATVESAVGPDNGRLQRVAGATVRDATFEVMRRYGLTTIFGNPGSTEIPFLTDLPVRHPVRPRPPRGLGRRDGHRLRDRARRARIRQPAHRSRARQRDQRDRQRARLPGAAGRGRRATGPPAARVRAISDGAALDRLAGEYPVWRASPSAPRTSRGRSPAPTTRPGRRGARRWSSYPWATGSSPPTSSRRERRLRLLHPRSVDAGAGRRARRDDRAAESPALVVGAGGEGTEGWDAVVVLAERLRCPVWQEPFSRARRVPAGPPAVCRSPVLAAPADARRARELRPRARARDERVPGLSVRRAGRTRRPGHARRGDHR